LSHGIKGFVIPTKSFVKIEITKIFCFNYKMFSSTNKTFGCWSKIFGCINKKLFVVLNFPCRNKTIFSPILFSTLHYFLLRLTSSRASGPSSDRQCNTQLCYACCRRSYKEFYFDVRENYTWKETLEVESWLRCTDIETVLQKLQKI